MAFTAPDNEHLLSNMTRPQEVRYRQFRDAAEKAAMMRPDLDQSANTKFLHDYLDAAVKNTAEQQRIMNEAKSRNIPLTVPAMRMTERRMQTEFQQEFINHTLPSYGPEGKEAFSVMSKNMTGGGIVEGAIKQFYDSDNKGIQYAGIIGGVLGAFLANKATGGFGGGLFGIASMIIGPIIGAFMLNRTAEALGITEKPNPYHQPRPTPAIAPVRTQHKGFGTGHASPAMHMEAIKAAMQPKPMTPPPAGMQGMHIDPHHTFNAPSTPSIRPMPPRVMHGQKNDPTR